MEILKKIGGYIVSAVLFIWGAVNAIVNWIGRTTVQDDWEQLMSERLPAWLDILLSAQPWMPGLAAMALAAFMIWLNWPREAPGPSKQKAKQDTDAITKHEDLEVIAGQDLRGSSVVLDGKHYQRCDLRGATLHYAGDAYQFTDCRMFDAKDPIKLLVSNRRAINIIELTDALTKQPAVSSVQSFSISLDKDSRKV